MGPVKKTKQKNYKKKAKKHQREINQEHKPSLDGDSTAAHFADAAMIPQTRLHRLLLLFFSYQSKHANVSLFAQTPLPRLIDKDVHRCERERLTGPALEIPLLICLCFRGAQTQKLTSAKLTV